MKYTFLLYLCILVGLIQPALAQERINTDSLLEITRGNFTPEEKVDAHYLLAIQYARLKNPSTISHAYKSLDLAKEVGYKKGLAKANLLIVELFQDVISNDSVITLLKESADLFGDVEMHGPKAKALNLLGILYERQGKYRLATSTYYAALLNFQTIGDAVGIANVKNNIGLIYQLQKNYQMALYFYKEAVLIGEGLKDQDILANAYNNMAICFQETKNPEKALLYFNKVYQIDSISDIPENLALSYNNLGVVQTDLRNYSLAKHYLFMALKMKQRAGEYLGLSNTYNNLATVYLQINKTDSALYFVRLAIKDAKLAHAFPYLQEAYEIYSKILEANGRYQEANEYLKLSKAVSDSVLQQESRLIMAQMEEDHKLDLAEKQKLVNEIEKEKEFFKNGLTLTLILLAFASTGLLLFYLAKVKKAFKNLQLKQRKIEVQNKILQVKNIEVVQAKEAAEEAYNVKSQFISTISHEIRTPLNAIVGVSNLLLLSDPKQEQIENLNILKISSDNLLHLVNNILDFSKMESGKLQLENIDFNLRDLVLDVKELFTIKAAEKGIELMVTIDNKIPNVLKGDPLRINQLLINLVNNAIKFTESGYVKLEVNLQLSTINHALVYFVISDTGIGIPSAKQGQIFNSFTQADANTTRKFGGTGLGLSICKRILDNLHSKLQVESVVGKGSKFSFSINFEVSRSASVGKSSVTASFEDSIKGKRVLVVEDNMMNVMVIRQFLQKWGVITEIALNGKEGISRLEEANYDAILMDIHMPEMDGIEATKLIRKMENPRKRNIPIIALTAENEMQFRQKVYEVGMNDYIFKPFNPDDLKERLGYALFNSNKKGVQSLA
ncbi:MAG: response regulator [Bacteroidia bacterium]|nr:response regulator [Bacteroidia bacterium]